LLLLLAAVDWRLLLLVAAVNWLLLVGLGPAAAGRQTWQR
jgi:hypothetical protein